MSSVRLITVAALLLLAGTSTSLLAQPPSHPSIASSSVEPTDALAWVVETYATLATLDRDHDGTLDAVEAEAVDGLVAAGVLLPPWLRATGIHLPAWVVLMRAARVYRWLVPFDLDGNGVLAATEAAAVASSGLAPVAGPPWGRRGGQ